MIDWIEPIEKQFWWQFSYFSKYVTRIKAVCLIRYSHKIEDHDHIGLAITECEEILINSLTCPVSPTEIIYLFEDAIAVYAIHINHRISAAF